jgi:tetratricopeptide (TPR) repeat protein
MSNDELKILRQSIDKFISINSFFSTSRHRHNAMDFLYSSNISNDLCRVLFIINANPRLAKSKPFADISSLSDIINESEVLFMIGCIFRLNDICYDDNKQIWKIQMDLCGDDEYDLKNLFNHIKNEYGCGENEVDLQSFGNVLHQMGKYDLAEKIYHRLLVETPSNDPSYSHLCYSLGMLTKDIKQYDLSLQWFQKSLEITISKDSVNSIHIAGLYCCIGNVYREQGNDNEAMDYYNIAIDYYRQAHAENHPHMAALYHGVASIHHDYKNYVEALNYYKQSLAIQEKYLPSAHSDIATNYDSIGTIHRHFREYDLAMNQHRRALEVRQKSLPSEHPDIGTSYKNMGLLYEARKEWSQALMYYRKAADIFRHSLSSQHPNVIEIEKDIHRASSIVK